MLNDPTVQFVINQLNRAKNQYPTEKEHFAWEYGVLVGLLAQAIKIDSKVADYLQQAIDQHNQQL